MHTPTQQQRYRVPIQRFCVVQAFPAPENIDHVEVDAAHPIEAMLTAMRSTGAWNAFEPTPILTLAQRREQLLAAGVHPDLAHRLAAIECGEATGTEQRRAA